MKKLAKIFCFCLMCVFASLSFVGCLGDGYVPAGIPSEKEIKDSMNKAVSDFKAEKLLPIFQDNYNGIKIVYIPDQADEDEANGALSVLDAAAEAALEYIKDKYRASLFPYAEFSWTDGEDAYILEKYNNEDYHYFTTLNPKSTQIKLDSGRYSWFDGEAWQTLQAVEGENYHYTFTAGGTTKYFYLNPDDATHKYFYNTTNSYVFVDETSVELEIYVENQYFYIFTGSVADRPAHPFFISKDGSFEWKTGDIELTAVYKDLLGNLLVPTSANLIVDLDGFVKTFKNKLVAAFINSSTGSSIPTGDSVDGTTVAYRQSLKDAILRFTYFGVNEEDLAAGKSFARSTFSFMNSETKEAELNEAFSLAKKVAYKTIYGEDYPADSEPEAWQYNIHIENLIIDKEKEEGEFLANNYIKDETVKLGARQYLSLIYMTKDTYKLFYADENQKPASAPEASASLFPDECSLFFYDNENPHATFMFKSAADTQSEFSKDFSIIRNGDEMPYEDEDGNKQKYKGDDVLNLEVFESTDDVANVFTLKTGFSKENDETANGSEWSGVVKTYSGSFNTSLLNALEWSKDAETGAERIAYVSETHDVLQIVFDKEESWDISGIGSLSLCAYEQFDWDSIKDFMDQEND